jgi:hypothetical protein
MREKYYCFFCGKELTQEEAMNLRQHYLRICDKCRKWLSQTKGKKQWEVFLVFFTFCSKFPILNKVATPIKKMIEGM